MILSIELKRVIDETVTIEINHNDCYTNGTIYCRFVYSDEILYLHQIHLNHFAYNLEFTISNVKELGLTTNVYDIVNNYKKIPLIEYQNQFEISIICHHQ